MAVYTTTSVVDITRPAEDVYDFVTTPGNWEGTHPVTAYVSGAQADRPTKLGRTFHEHIVGVAGQVDLGSALHRRGRDALRR